jgi:type II secretory pathway pseudopilin PulG
MNYARMNNNNLLKKNNGFTFLELLVATGILVVSLSGMVSAYISCSKMAETTKNSNLALGAIQEQLEALRKVPLSNSTTLYYFTIADNVSGFLKNTGRITITPINLNFSRVDADICWEQGSRIIGPCSDQNGTLVFNAPNVNGDSTAPVQVTTFMAQR